MTFEWVSLSNVGGRKMNEDFLGAFGEGNSHCFVVADGLGAYKGSDFASKIAVEAILQSFQINPAVALESVKNLIVTAQNDIVDFRKTHKDYDSIRTTVVLMLSDGKNTYCGHLGDSRLYHFRQQSILFETVDHSIAQSAVAMGIIKQDEIRKSPDKNKIFKALGADNMPKPDAVKLKHPILPGDGFLLCSDGFWEYILENEMIEDFYKSASPEEWLKSMENRLLKRVKGNHDNYSAICIKIK